MQHFPNKTRERLFLLGLITLACIPTSCSILRDSLDGGALRWQSFVFPILQGLFFFVALWFLFRRRASQNRMAQLDHEGQLMKDAYYVSRVFVIRTTTGPAYYIGLDDGRVLFLHGDYLAEYDGRKPLTARAFPCTDFSTLRDKTTGQILGLSCTGTRLDPEFTAPENPTRSLPADGTLITDRSYSAIKSDYA